MPDPLERIEQFRNMTLADPDNELGHFSLGKALLDANRPTEASASLERTLELNPALSKVHQLLAMARLGKNDREGAIAALTAGVTVADQRGDLMPRDEMIAMLKDLGAPVPAIRQNAAPAQAVGECQVMCKRCGQIGPKLAKAPFKNDFGQKILAHICQPCWRAAIGQGTKVINELRLPMHDPQAQRIWDQHIREFLNLEGK